MKRGREPDQAGPVQKRARLHAAEPHLLLDFPLELTAEIHVWLDPMDRINLQRTCHTCYDWDPGLIMATAEQAYVDRVTEAFKPTSPFAAEKISYQVEILENPAQRRVRRVTAQVTADGVALVSLPRCDRFKWNDAVCGLWKPPADYAAYGKYYTQGTLDMNKVEAAIRQRNMMFLDEDEIVEPTRDQVEAWADRIRAKYKLRRLLVVYAARRARERVLWENTYTLKVRVVDMRRLQERSNRLTQICTKAMPLQRATEELFSLLYPQ